MYRRNGSAWKYQAIRFDSGLRYFLNTAAIPPSPFLAIGHSKAKRKMTLKTHLKVCTGIGTLYTIAYCISPKLYLPKFSPESIINKSI